MPVVRLRVASVGSAKTEVHRQYLDPPAAKPVVRVVPILRLMTTVNLVAEPGSRRTANPRTENALIDTGAWVSVIDRPTWEMYEHDGLLERLEHPVHGLSFDTGAGMQIVGAKSGFVFGKVWVRVLDADDPRRSLPPVRVVAQLLLSRKLRLPTPIILGLHLGILDGRKLVREPVMGHDSPPADDCGARYGQAWRLETA